MARTPGRDRTSIRLSVLSRGYRRRSRRRWWSLLRRLRSATAPRSLPGKILRGGASFLNCLRKTKSTERHAIAAMRRARLDAEVKSAFRHYVYLLATINGPEVQYKSLPEPASSLSGSDVWSALRRDGRAVGLGELSAEYVSQLIVSGNYGRDLTPKEIFANPYSDPAWPLIQSDADMRNALFVLATSSEWELVDSDGAEVRPASPSQIQPATLQQMLRRRRSSPRSNDGSGLDDGSGSSGGGETGGSEGGSIPGESGRDDLREHAADASVPVDE